MTNLSIFALQTLAQLYQLQINAVHAAGSDAVILHCMWALICYDAGSLSWMHGCNGIPVRYADMHIVARVTARLVAAATLQASECSICHLSPHLISAEELLLRLLRLLLLLLLRLLLLLLLLLLF